MLLSEGGKSHPESSLTDSKSRRRLEETGATCLPSPHFPPLLRTVLGLYMCELPSVHIPDSAHSPMNSPTQRRPNLEKKLIQVLAEGSGHVEFLGKSWGTGSLVWVIPLSWNIVWVDMFSGIYQLYSPRG